VQAAPTAVRVERGKTSAAAKFPEFRAWHALLLPLFGIPAPDWSEKQPEVLELDLVSRDETTDDETPTMADEDEEEEEEEEDEG